MFECPHCKCSLVVQRVPAEPVANGTIVEVAYTEVAEIDASSGSESELSAFAVVLGTQRDGRVKVAWLLPVADVTFAAGHRIPTRSGATHVVDNAPVAVGRDTLTPTDHGQFAVENSGVYDEATRTLDTTTSYTAFLAASFIHSSGSFANPCA